MWTWTFYTEQPKLPGDDCFLLMVQQVRFCQQFESERPFILNLS